MWIAMFIRNRFRIGDVLSVLLGELDPGEGPRSVLGRLLEVLLELGSAVAQADVHAAIAEDFCLGREMLIDRVDAVQLGVRHI